MQNLASAPATLTPISEFMRGYDHAASLDPVTRHQMYRQFYRQLSDSFSRGFAALTTGDHEGARR